MGSSHSHRVGLGAAEVEEAEETSTAAGTARAAEAAARLPLDPGPVGLSQPVAQARLREIGPNELQRTRSLPMWRRFWEVAKEPMFLLLLAAASIYFFLGEVQEGVTMLVFVGMVILVTFIQEWRTERALAALRNLSAPQALVYRDRHWLPIPARELVPGDFVAVQEGDRVPADVRLTHVADLCVDESLLTGEAEPIWKSPGDMGLAGTVVLQGQGWGEVAATGPQTQYGQIGELLAKVEQQVTPLQRQVGALVRQFFVAGLIVCALVTALVAWQTRAIAGGGWTAAFLAGLSLAMAMIPEEFPVVLTVFFALGAARLSRQQALARRLPAVETLGAVQVLCVDKTGTLTENRMTMRTCLPWQDEEETAVAYYALLASEENAYDPMDLAIEQWTLALGMPPASVRGALRLAQEYPFRPADRWMGHIWQDAGGAYQLAVKGASETVLPLCGLAPTAYAQATAAAARLAGEGLRVLAVATQAESGGALRPPFPTRLAEHRLRLLGFVGLADPPRAGVREAVAACHQAGVRVVMITGDHAGTAVAIAREVGIAHGDQEPAVLTGTDLERLGDEELTARLAEQDPERRVEIFARVVPGQKLRLVRAFRQLGQVVAMTGDGVNDAPALKQADIGVAMGKRGTDVAREAAGLVLLDDNFVTIVRAIRQGRLIYDNIRKAVAYIVVAHLPIAGLALLAPLLGLPLFLWPVHIALLELLLDPTCSVVFEASPAEPDLMQRPPRRSQAGLVTLPLVVQMLALGGALLVAVFLLYQQALAAAATETYARSLGLATLLLGNVGVVYTMSSEREPFWTPWIRRQAGSWRSRTLLALGTGLALVAILYVPALSAMMGTEPLGGRGWLLSLGVAALVTLWWEGVKLVRRRMVH